MNVSSGEAFPLIRQHLNSLKGIETCLKHLELHFQRPDNTWIPWKGLKQIKEYRKVLPAEYLRQHLNSLKGIETFIILKQRTGYFLLPTTLEFPERDWNFLWWFESSCCWCSGRQHLNSLKGIETFIRSSSSHSPKLFRQHLNSLKGIETLRIWRITPPISTADNTWIPWKGLKQGSSKRQAYVVLWSDNTWIPWKGLKHNYRHSWNWV